MPDRDRDRRRAAAHGHGEGLQGQAPGSTRVAALIAPDAPHRIRLLTRPGCSLCSAAREIVRRVAAEEVVGWDEQDVDADPDLADEYGDRVPVVLLDGAEHAYWRVDERRLRDALHGRRTY